MRFGRQQLGLNEPFLFKLVPVVVESMGGMFPELRTNPQRVVDLMMDEERSFGRTLERGIALFDMAAQSAIWKEIWSEVVKPQLPLNAQTPDWKVSSDDSVLLNVGSPESGARPDYITITPNASEQIPLIHKYCKMPPRIDSNEAFKLHDTYGFPIDLTRIMAEERGMTVDIAGYEKLMEEAKEKARTGGRAENTRLSDLSPDAFAELAQEGIQPTDDQPKYSREPIQAHVMAIWNGDTLGLSPADVFEDEELAILLDRTNFYAEMGGQIGDAGDLRASGGGIFDVKTTRAVGGYVLHIGRIRAGKLRVTDTVTTLVHGGRDRTEKNHTTTHLANWALREVLGDDVQQKGSLVDPEKLRFDFSHGKALADEELARVETLVNEGIGKKLPVYAEVAPQEQALKIHGLRAVFGEKYPPMVRVVSVGVSVKDLLENPGNPKWRDYSIEFCGGTHLANAGDAETFRDYRRGIG